MTSLQQPSRGRPSGFTLIELMVVAAILAVLLTVTVPAIRGILETSQMAQAENAVRASLFSARNYAVKNGMVAGVRFQDDGSVVQIYARGVWDYTTNPAAYYQGINMSRDNYTHPLVYDMRSIEGVDPQRVPDPYRVTMCDVGNCNSASGSSGDMKVCWQGSTECGYAAATQWLDTDHAWFIFPVVLFNPRGRVILADCQFSGDVSFPWYPTLDGALTGSFAKATTAESNSNPIPAHNPLRFTNQVALVGWRCNGYKGGSSHNIPVEAPSVTSSLRVFNYTEFRGQLNKAAALNGIISSCSDMFMDVNTGMVVRKQGGMKTGSN